MGRSRGILAVSILVSALACAAPASAPAAVAPCTVPEAGHPTLYAALTDADCDPINLAGLEFDAMTTFPVDRDVTLVGSGTGLTLLKGDGGGPVLTISSGHTVAIRDLTITGGGGSLGGGVKTASNLSLTRVAVRGNSATVAGGIFAGSGADITLTIHDSVISGNHATAAIGGNGGGMSADVSTTANLRNVTIAGNMANGFGGGIYVDGAADAVNLDAVTVANNFADNDADSTGTGGGAFTQSDLSLRNSIVAANTDKSPTVPASTPDCVTDSGAVHRQGYVLIGNDTGCAFGAPDDPTGYQGDIDPLLGALAMHGGPTATMALPLGSPALDRIPAASCTSSADQRGVPRPQPTGGLCDLGAFELEQALPPVSAAATSSLPVVATKKCKKKKKKRAAAAKKKCRKKKKH